MPVSLHEQNNKTIKGDGGAVDIFGSETTLVKWMVTGSEIARMMHELKQTAAVIQNADSPKHIHHEHTGMFQSCYSCHVSEVVKSVHQCGNLFAEQQLQTADNRKIIMTAVVAVGSLDPL